VNVSKRLYLKLLKAIIFNHLNIVWTKKTLIQQQYYTIRDYKAAIKANDNFISSFPGTKFREEALYTKFIAAYKIAINSIDSKKTDRLEELIQQYNTIIRYYPETLFLVDLDKKMKKVNSDLELIKKATSQQTK
jgi:outer membrane protein assembly factor BamD